MATDTPKAPKPAKPVKKAATTATPKAVTARAASPKPAAAKPSRAAPTPKPAQTPKPVKPKKGPTVDTSTIDKPESSGSSAKPADTKPNASQLIKDSAAKLTKEAGDKARAYAEEGKTRAGGVLDELARMMNEAAGTVDEKLGEQYGQYARSAAGGVSDFSDSLKAKKLDDLIEDARDFVKKSPAVAIGTAAALGFVLVRLIKSGLDAADRDA
ncbi:hypothetical protein GCM10009087_39130 [Sphingomonas oligophenolica]|uniref:DUF883 family protein n=1 Tax=Sphingomonas oligophenolica TaxID=301154 RepID=A0ABU9Y2F8_9SPHN